MRRRTIIVVVVGLLVAGFLFAASALADSNRKIKITNVDTFVAVGGKLPIKTEVINLEDDAPKKTVLKWLSENEEIAKVNAQGVVSAISPGKARIICTAQDDESITSSFDVTVFQPIKAINPQSTAITLLLGSTDEAARGKIIIDITPDNATDQTLCFTSSDESIVTVDQEGNLRAQSEGKAKITVAPNEQGSKLKAVCNITVGRAVSEISIPESITVAKGRNFQFKPEISPSNAINKKVTYESSNPDVATVTNAGVVKGVACGKATIKCAAADGSNASKYCEVTVIQPATKITCSIRKKVLFSGEKANFHFTVLPDDATNKKLSFASSDSRVVSINEHGMVTAESAGKAKVTASTTDGSNKSISVDVIVEPSTPISLDSIGFGIFNYNLLGITVTNRCKASTIVDFDFDLAFYDYTGSLINSGSFSLGNKVAIKPGQKKTIKRTVFGTGQAYKTVITITAVQLKDGTIWSIPYSQQETWSFTR